MLKLIDRLLYEPAVFLGFTAAAIVFAFKIGQPIGVDDVLQILTPLGAGLGTRQLVKPVRKRKR